MKTLSRRSICVMVLAAFFCAGLTFFLFDYLSNAPEWVTHPSNQHVYRKGVITDAGRVIDADGLILAETVDGKRKYNAKQSIREATVHVVGDRQGNIASSVQRVFRDELVGYNILTGVGGDGGYDLKLTISASASADALKALGKNRGTVGVYNYMTGEILLIASSPAFDPDNPPKLTDNNKDKYEGMFINRFFSSVYTPGSVFKVITAAAAIDSQPELLNETFECTGSTDYNGDKITCPKKHGHLTFGQALTVSCNTAFAQISLRVGAQKLTAAAEAAGFNTRLRADEIRLSQSKFDVSGVNDADLAWAGIGQYTDLANPCHMMLIMGSIANKGQAASPYLLHDVTTDTGFVIRGGNTQMSQRMFSAGTCETLAALMRDNVKNNYGDKQFGKLKVCAKSGTAEVGKDKKPHAWFAGFVQNEDYPLAFAVIVENGGSGSGVAAPVAAAALKSAASVLDRQRKSAAP